MIHRTTPIAFAVALATLSSSHAFAQAEIAKRLDQVVVTAARTPMQLSDVLADVVVLTRADIERQGYGDLSDLLRASGAVQLSRTGGPGSTASLYIRGAETRHTMVLIDGVRVDTQSTAGAPWETLPMSQIERIEIVKGPASAIYGSDAIGGVIQIFTAKGDGATKLDLGVAGGSLGTARADAGLRGKAGMFDYALSAASEHSDGFILHPDPNDPSHVDARAGYQKHNASARLGAQLDAQDRIEFITLSSHLNAAYDGFKAGALYHAIETTTTDKLAWSRQWTDALDTQLSYGESKERYDAPNDFYLTETHTRNYSFDGSWRLAPGQQLLFVLERREDKLVDSFLTDSGPGTGTRSDNGAALGYIGKFGPLDLEAHGRHDSNSDFGSSNTGSLGLGYALSPGLRIVASAGNAFRAPTLSQDYSTLGPLSLPGGQSLKAETSHNVEIGLKYLADSTEASVTAYRNRISNLIDFDASTKTCLDFASFNGCYGNVAQARLQGMSVAGSTQAGPVRLSATLDLQDPKNLESGKLLPRRSRQFGSLRAETTQQGWDLGTGLLFSGKRYDDADNTTVLGGYALLNLDAAYKLTRELKLQLNLDNAFNRTYQTAQGYAQPPRTVMVGLRYTPSF